MKYKVRMSSYLSGDNMTLDAASIEAAVRVCKLYCVIFYVMENEWTGGQVYDENDVLVAQINYDGIVNEEIKELC